LFHVKDGGGENFVAEHGVICVQRTFLQSLNHFQTLDIYPLQTNKKSLLKKAEPSA